MFGPLVIAIATLVAAVAGVITIVPTTLGWLETRRQRQLTEQVKIHPGVPATGKPVTGENRQWRCGIYDYPPLSTWPNPSAVGPSGPLVVLAKRLAETLDKSLLFETFAYDDFYRDAVHIPDLIMGMFETKRRAANVVFSRPLYEIGLQGICRKDQEGDILLGLREGNLRVAVYSGEVGWEFVVAELPDAINEHRVATLVGGHQMHTMALLTEGRYDVVMMDQLSCQNFLNEGDHRLQFRLAFREAPRKFQACVALKREHEGLLDAVNNAIVDIRNSKDFLALEEQSITGFDQIIERRALRSRK